MELKDYESALLEDRLPKAFDKAVNIYRKAQTLVYATVVRCVEEMSDVSIELESDNPICKFLDIWGDTGLYDQGSLSFGYNDNGKKELTCKFDLYGIRDTLYIIGDDLFGTLNAEHYDKKLDEFSNISPFSAEEVGSMECAIQKVKLRADKKSEKKISSKKDIILN